MTVFQDGVIPTFHSLCKIKGKNSWRQVLKDKIACHEFIFTIWSIYEVFIMARKAKPSWVKTCAILPNVLCSFFLYAYLFLSSSVERLWGEKSGEIVHRKGWFSFVGILHHKSAEQINVRDRVCRTILKARLRFGCVIVPSMRFLRSCTIYPHTVKSKIEMFSGWNNKNLKQVPAFPTQSIGTELWLLE